METSLTKLTDVMFRVVSFGYGSHWQLSDKESEALGASLAECAQTVSSKKMKAIEAIIDKVAPWAGLCITTGMIVYPRYMQTQVNIQVARMRAAQGGGVDGSTGKVVGSIGLDAAHEGEHHEHATSEGDTGARVGLGERRPYSANHDNGAGNDSGAGE